MLDLQQVESFRMVALTHNFTRAAAELGCSQSSVTLHVKSLERELGASLLERHRFCKTVQLTELGRRTLDYDIRDLEQGSGTVSAIRAPRPAAPQNSSRGTVGLGNDNDRRELGSTDGAAPPVA